MRSGLFFIFLGLVDISNTLSTKPSETPEGFVPFIGLVILIAMVMDVVEFFKSLEK